MTHQDGAQQANAIACSLCRAPGEFLGTKWRDSSGNHQSERFRSFNAE
jgi:hypothetical protein